MEIRLKYTGEVVKVSRECFSSDGQLLGYVIGDPAAPGGEVYYSKEDVAEAPDWVAYRREAAKDILCAILRSNQTDDNNKPFRTFEDLAKGSVACADELIKQLKEK